MLNKSRLILFLAGALVAIFTSQRFKPLSLPSGLITQTEPLDSSFIVTPAPLPGRPLVNLSTTKGDITLELRPDLAPQNIVNLLTKLNTKSCDNALIVRSENWIVQGCNIVSPQSTISPEISSTPFTKGSLGLSGSQLFIVKKDSDNLNTSFTYLGKVTEGMDVVTSLEIGDKIISSAILSK